MSRINLPLSVSFEKSVEALTKALQNYLVKRYENLKPTITSKSHGDKYIKISLTTGVGFSQKMTTVCFIVKHSTREFKEGDILKASGDRPLTNFARGNILRGGEILIESFQL